MYSDFFQGSVVPADAFSGIYSPGLVMLSCLVAIFASYTALDLTGRLRDKGNTRTSNLLWLIGGAIAMGSGIWSMHFIGMLSFTIPGISLEYDYFWTAVSLIVAICASGFALFLLKKSIINVVHLMAGGIILGFAIASMHYTGMAAMLISLNIRYVPGLFLLSIFVAIVASEGAIWFALKSNAVVVKFRNRVKILSAIVMGLAICGMHYTGMAASIFTPLCQPLPTSSQINGLDPSVLSVVVAVVTLIVLCIAFFASSYKDALNRKQFEHARELGIAEISATVLHNVGNVLNSLNISIETIVEKLKSSPMYEIKKLAALLAAHQEDLPAFITKDPRGTHLVGYVQELSEYWQTEQDLLIKECEESTKHLLLIKSIISSQQEIIKTNSYEEVIAIHDLLDELLTISGVFHQEIRVQKEYGDIDPILVDKVKLFQILNNIIINAKEALLESSNENKHLIIKTQLISKDKIAIEISENGIGILPENIEKIFRFGFSTKKSGHGFGLHTSALAINELGGEIHVDSKGFEQGSTFTLYLPNRKAIFMNE